MNQPQEYIDSMTDEQSSVASDTVHIDLLNELNLGDSYDIFDRTKGEKQKDELQHSTTEKVRLHETMNYTLEYTPFSPCSSSPIWHRQGGLSW